jgi:hypothetical protein
MAATILLAAITVAVALILMGCAIPIPPSGDRMGEIGTITVQVGYTPKQLSNNQPLPASTTTK